VDYENSGNADATGVVLTDDPNEAYVASVDASLSGGLYDGNLVTWSLGTLASGGSGSVAYDVVLASAGTFPAGTTNVVNTVSLSSNEDGPVTDSATVPVDAQVILAVTKSVSGYLDNDANGVLSPGDTVQYAVTAANNGNADSTSTVLTDDPDEIWVASIANISDLGIYDGNTIDWDLGTLGAGESLTVTYEAVLGSAGTFPHGTTDVNNTAALFSAEDGPVYDTASVTVTAAVSLSVTKASTGYTDTDGSGALSPGDTVHYQVDYANAGDADATGASLSDDPDETYVASISAISGGGLYDGNTISWTLGTIAAGTSGSLTYDAELGAAGTFADGTTAVNNTATLTSNEDGPLSDSETVTVSADALLAITCSIAGYVDNDADGQISPSDTVTFQLDYTNSGDASATNVSITDDVPESAIASVDSITGGGLYDGDLVTWSLGTVAAGDSGSLTWTATLAPSGSFVHGTTTVSTSSALTATEGTDACSSSVDVVAAAALSLNKASTGYTDTDANGALSPGDTVHYQLDYQNTGNADATGAALSDDPDETYVASISAISGGGLYDGNTISWSLGTIAAGTSGSLTYDAVLGAAGTFADGTTAVNNTATLTSNEDGPHSAVESVVVTAAANLSLTCSVAGYVDNDADGQISPSDSVTFQLDYANSGNAAATSVALSDDVPESAVASVDSISDLGTYDGDLVTWSVGTVAAGDSGFVTWTATLSPAGSFVHGTTTVSTSSNLSATEGSDACASSIDVTAAAALSLAKASTGYTDTDGNGVLSPGDTVHYQLDYQNSGNADATSAALSDDPDETYVSGISAISGGGLYDGNTISWSLGTIAAGTSGTLTYDALMGAAGTFADGTTPVNNTATLTSNEDGPHSASETVTVTAGVSLAVAKSSTGTTDTDGDGMVSPGDTVHYQVVATNNGDADANNVSLSDDPDETYVASIANISDLGLYDGATISWSLGTLAAGGSVTVTYDAVLHVDGTFPAGMTNVVNTVSLSSDEDGPITDSETVVVDAAADVTLAKASTGYTDSDGDGLLSPGDTVHYQLDWANNGDADANNAVLVDDPDETYVASIGTVSGGGLYDGNTILWNLGTLAAGTSGSLTYDAVLGSAGTFVHGSTLVSNTASLTTDETGTVNAGETVVVEAAASLAVSKSSTGYTDVDGDLTLSPGDVVQYAVSYANNGNAAANNASVSDDPDETYAASVGSISDLGVYDGNLISWTLGTIAPGASGTLTYDVTLAAAGTFAQGATGVTNSVSLTSDEDGPVTDTETVFVDALAEIAVVKTATGSTDVDLDGLLSPGDIVHYTVDYANNGNADANNAVLTDDPDETYVVAVDATLSGGTYDGNLVTWSLGTLAAGTAGSVSYDVTLGGAGTFADGTTLVDNTVSLSSDEDGPVSDSDSVVVTAAVELSLTCSVAGYVDADGDGQISPSDTVTFQLDYANAGNADANSVSISDDVPESAVASLGAISGGGLYDGNLITWTLGTVLAGDSGTLTWEAVLAPAGTFTHGTTTVATGSSLSATEGSDACSSSIDVVAAADITLTKVSTGYTDTDASGALSPGDVVAYTLSYGNIGNADATGVTLTDDPDESWVTAVDATLSGGTYDGNLISWSIGSIAAGDTGSVSYEVTLASAGTFPDGATNVVNTATLTSNEDGPETASETVTVGADAALSIVKTSSGYTDTDANGVLSPGDTVHYDLSYANDGDANANNVTVVDDPDESWVASIANVSGLGAYDGNLITWTIGTVAPGGGGSLTYDAVLQPAGVFPDGVTPVINVAVVSSDEDGPVNDTETVTVTAAPILGIVKSLDSTEAITSSYSNTASVSSAETTTVTSNTVDATVTTSTRLTYSIVIENTGTADASGVTVDEALPAGTSVESASGVWSEAGGIVTWTIGSLPVGASDTQTIVLIAD